MVGLGDRGMINWCQISQVKNRSLVIWKVLSADGLQIIGINTSVKMPFIEPRLVCLAAVSYKALQSGSRGRHRCT